jgi:hypothetical protein
METENDAFTRETIKFIERYTLKGTKQGNE